MDDNGEIFIAGSAEYGCDSCGANFNTDETGGHYTCKDLCNWDCCRKCMRKNPWKQGLKCAEIHGGDGPEWSTNTMDEVIQKYGNNHIPQIAEIGLYFDAYVAGIKVVYRDDETLPGGHTVEHFGSAGGEYEYRKLKLKKGEYITKIDGRIGSWTDELKTYTSRGKCLKGGDDGGGDYDPQYEG